MIFELRTYDLYPTRLADYFRHLQSAPDIHAILSPHLRGFFQTEVGPLNQVVHLYKYDSFEHRQEVRSQLARRSEFPTFVEGLRPFLLRQDNKIMTAAAISPMQD
jgi:hypothetical protein